MSNNNSSETNNDGDLESNNGYETNYEGDPESNNDEEEWYKAQKNQGGISNILKNNNIPNKNKNKEIKNYISKEYYKELDEYKNNLLDLPEIKQNNLSKDNIKNILILICLYNKNIIFLKYKKKKKKEINDEIALLKRSLLKNKKYINFIKNSITCVELISMFSCNETKDQNVVFVPNYLVQSGGELDNSILDLKNKIEKLSDKIEKRLKISSIFNKDKKKWEKLKEKADKILTSKKKYKITNIYEIFQNNKNFIEKKAKEHSKNLIKGKEKNQLSREISNELKNILKINTSTNTTKKKTNLEYLNDEIIEVFDKFVININKILKIVKYINDKKLDNKICYIYKSNILQIFYKYINKKNIKYKYNKPDLYEILEYLILLLDNYLFLFGLLNIIKNYIDKSISTNNIKYKKLKKIKNLDEILARPFQTTTRIDILIKEIIKYLNKNGNLNKKNLITSSYNEVKKNNKQIGLITSLYCENSFVGIKNNYKNKKNIKKKNKKYREKKYNDIIKINNAQLNSEYNLSNKYLLIGNKKRKIRSKNGKEYVIYENQKQNIISNDNKRYIYVVNNNKVKKIDVQNIK